MLSLLFCGLLACGGADQATAPAEPASPVLALAAPSPASLVWPLAEGERSTAVAAAALDNSLDSALGTHGRVVLTGLPTVPTRARPWPDTSPAGRRFHVDSQLGNDKLDGRTVDRPWRSLARLTTAALEPGDRIVLACGSRWRESLRLGASGTAARPLVIEAAAGCSQPPTIDGSVDLPASAWVRQAGAVYVAALAPAPLQLFSSAGVWVEAHHPNRGANGPGFFTMAADGNLASANGRDVSTRLGTGDDLLLPPAARLGSGSHVRVRSAAFVIDDLPIAGVDGHTLTLASPSTYPLKAGWGYLLTGQAWMVDSAGEWFHDAAGGRLLAHDLGGSAEPRLPTSASVLATGIDLQGRAHVVVDGLLVRKVGTGALLQRSQAVQVRNSRFEDLADRGIDAAESSAVVIESNRIERSGTDAVFAGGIGAGAAIGLTVRNNHIRSSGVLMAGAAVLSLPRRSYGAILAGQAATVSDNLIVDSGYIGIRVFERSVVERNVVVGSCSVLDDCGAIYTLGAGNDSRIVGNLVLHVRGNTAGKPSSNQASQAQGIYLDDDAAGVRVERNTVIGADHGLQLHDASANQVLDNRLYGNRVAQLWMQETRLQADGSGTTRGNRIEGNQFAPLHARSRSLLLETHQSSAASFGSFDRNRYFDAAPGRIGSVGTAVGGRDFTAAQWFATPGLASTGAADPQGSASSGDGHASYTVAGANLVPNGNLAAGAAGWSHWNATAPHGQLHYAACDASPCLRYTGGAPSGLVSSPNFSLEQGNWYRLAVDIATDAEDQPLQLVVRRGGGGSNGYELLAERDLSFIAGTRWQRYSVVYQATRSVRSNDDVTGDLGARFDIEGVAAGRSLSLARLEIMSITPSLAPRISLALVNAGDASVDLACPLADDQARLCTQLADLADPAGSSDARRVTWPVRLAPRSAVLLRAFEAASPDSDGDGISDWQDSCPGSAHRQVVNAAGCALEQR